LPITRHAASLVAIVLRMVIAQHLLNPLISLPRDVRRIAVPNDDPPLVRWQKSLLHFPRVFRPYRASSPIHEGTGVSWILRHRTKSGNSRALPVDRSKAITARNGQVLVTEVMHDLSQRFLLQQNSEDQQNYSVQLPPGKSEDKTQSYQQGPKVHAQ